MPTTRRHLTTRRVASRSALAVLTKRRTHPASTGQRRRMRPSRWRYRLPKVAPADTSLIAKCCRHRQGVDRYAPVGRVLIKATSAHAEVVPVSHVYRAPARDQQTDVDGPGLCWVRSLWHRSLPSHVSPAGAADGRLQQAAASRTPTATPIGSPFIEANPAAWISPPVSRVPCPTRDQHAAADRRSRAGSGSLRRCRQPSQVSPTADAPTADGQAAASRTPAQLRSAARSSEELRPPGPRRSVACAAPGGLRSVRSRGASAR